MKVQLLLFGTVLFTSSCNANAILDGSEKSNSSPSATDTPDDDNIKSTELDTEPTVIELEKASPPVQVYGSYLDCSIYPNSKSSSTEGFVACSLRDGDGSLVAFSQRYTEYSWASVPTIVPEVLTIEKTIELVLFKFSGSNADDLSQKIYATRYKFSGKRADGTEESFEAGLSQAGYAWKKGVNTKIPADAVQGGTEQSSTAKIYLCRVYYQNAVIPGKLLELTEPSVKSRCFFTYKGESLAATDDKGKALYDYEVLVSNESSKALQFLSYKLVAAPGETLIAGKDEAGNPLYFCRSLESRSTNSQKPNLPQGEYTPGYIAEGSNVCTYEYFGESTSKQYQYLAGRHS